MRCPPNISCRRGLCLTDGEHHRRTVTAADDNPCSSSGPSGALGAEMHRDTGSAPAADALGSPASESDGCVDGRPRLRLGLAGAADAEPCDDDDDDDDDGGGGGRGDDAGAGRFSVINSGRSGTSTSQAEAADSVVQRSCSVGAADGGARTTQPSCSISRRNERDLSWSSLSVRGRWVRNPLSLPVRPRTGGRGSPYSISADEAALLCRSNLPCNLPARASR